MIEKIITKKKNGLSQLYVRAEGKRPLGIALIRLGIKHAKLLGIIFGVACLSSVIFTSPWFIRPMYLSQVILYPPSSNTSSTLINSDMRFGSDRDIDNAIQVLESGILQDSIVRKYHLMEHYEINQQSGQKYYKMSKEYHENVNIDRTRYNSIAVSVYDVSPETAASIANDIVKIGDEVKAEIIKKNLRSAYESSERELSSKMHEMLSLRDSIEFLKSKNYDEALGMLGSHYKEKKQAVESLRNSIEKVRNEQGIYDLNEQYNSMYKTYLKANADYVTDSGMVEVMTKYLPASDTALIRRKAEMLGSRIIAGQLKDKLKKLNESGSQYNMLMDNYSFEKNLLSALEGDYEISSSTFNKEYDNLHLNTLKNRYQAEMELYNTLKAKYELALNNFTDHVPASYIVSPATPSYHKEYPKRILITALVGISALLLSLLILLVSQHLPAFVASVKE